MSPRSQPVVNEINSWEICSPKVVALMIGCWRRDIDGIVCCLRWVKASWWDLSTVLGFPLSSLRLTNHISCHYQSLTQSTHSKIRRPTSAPVPLNSSLSWFSQTPMLTNLCSMFSYFLSHNHILLHLPFTIMMNLITVSPTLDPLLTHSLLLSIFS